jgi:hypothetical protein
VKAEDLKTAAQNNVVGVENNYLRNRKSLRKISFDEIDRISAYIAEKVCHL